MNNVGSLRADGVLVDAGKRVGHVMRKHQLPLGRHLGTLRQHPDVATVHQFHRTSEHSKVHSRYTQGTPDVQQLCRLYSTYFRNLKNGRDFSGRDNRINIVIILIILVPIFEKKVYDEF